MDRNHELRDFVVILFFVNSAKLDLWFLYFLPGMAVG